MQPMESGDLQALRKLVQKATNQNEERLDAAQAKQIRDFAKKSEDNVRLVQELLMDRLKWPHAETRLHVLELCDQLMQRSKAFRQLLSQDFTPFLELCLGFRPESPLPGPPARAAALRATALEVVERWGEDYGVKHRQFALGYRYLRDQLKFKFPEVRAHAAAAEAQERERQARGQAIAQEKYEQLCTELEAKAADIRASLNQLGEAFDLLEGKAARAARATPRVGQGVEAGSDEDWEDIPSQGGSTGPDDAEGDLACGEQGDLPTELLEGAGPGGLRLSLRQIQQADPAVLDTVHALGREVQNRHLPTVQEWQRVLSRVAEPATGQERTRRERMLRTTVELRGTLLTAAGRVGELDAAVATARELAAGDAPPAGLATHDQQHPPSLQSPQLPTSGAGAGAGAGAAVGATGGIVAMSTAQPPTRAGRQLGGTGNGGLGRTAEQQAMLDDLFGSDDDDEEAPHAGEPAARCGQQTSATRAAPAQAAQQGGLPAAGHKQARKEANAQQHRGSSQTKLAPVLDPAAPSRHMTFGLQPVARQAMFNPEAGTAGSKLSSVLAPLAAQLAPDPTSAIVGTERLQIRSGSQDATQYTSSASQAPPQGPQGSSPPSAAQASAASSARAGASQAAQSGPKPAMPSPTSRSAPQPASKPGLSSKLAALAAKKQAAQARRAAEDEQKSAGSSGQAELAPEIKQALLAQAPKIPAGVYLDYWDSKRSRMLVNARGMELSNHWGAHDQDVELPAEQVKAMFGMRAEYWTPQTASAQPARQPVLRQTAAPGSSTGPAEVGLQAAPATQAAAASSGRGVQVQRAADRAHNEAVLAGSSTDAALAQSLQDEEQQAALSGEQQPRGRKRTKPQPTVRERLAKKLLTGRARDKTDSELDAVIEDRHGQLNANRWAER